jgi:hypothetical protein
VVNVASLATPENVVCKDEPGSGGDAEVAGAGAIALALTKYLKI